jgi:beta-galactosidase
MTAAREFAIGERDFLLDGQPFRIMSGALHYFRVHPGHWADRIRKARQMGLNTVETYVAWNAHAPRAGEFHLDGRLDLGRFLDLVAEEGMNAIVRPGPYICGEWTNGGLPAWLYRDSAIGIRRSEPAYLVAVRRYLDQLSPVIVPRQVDRGGPILLVQVENEYGAYGADKGYLAALAVMLREAGVTVPLITVDQARDEMLANGTLPGALATGSFGSDVAARLAVLRRHQPDGPLMCAEFWDGWFDDWGGHHHLTPAAQAAAHLDELLSAGASVNIYMFHGGTNFGLTSGANDKGTYQPITTSYDYDAPLDEAGNPTAKYWAFREVIARHTTVCEDRPDAAAPSPELTVVLGQSLPLWAVAGRLGRWARHDEVVTMDEIGQYQGLAIYQADIDLRQPSVLTVGEVRDRAQVFLDGQPVGILARDHHERSLPLPAARRAKRARLEILLEDQGRVNYGPRTGEPKGLIGPVAVNGDPVRGWRVLPLLLDDIAPVAEALRRGPAETVTTLPGPVFARAVFDLTTPGLGAPDPAPSDPPNPGDLFLSTAGLGKGIAWLNGFCLGRYWSRGPQRTLYVPGPVTREAGNELIILELQAAATATVAFTAGPDLGHTER